MDKYTATEQAYKNGYEQGKKDAVIHAHWIEEQTETGRKVYCSNCKSSAPFVCIADDYYDTRMHGEIQKTKCCPDCGAKMDGTEDIYW